MQCFTAIEGLNPENDDWRPAVDPSSMLLHGLKHKHALKDYRTYAPPIHEGYALFIKEKEAHYDTEFNPFIISCIVTAIPVLYNPELNRVAFVLTAVIYGLGLWASCCLASSRLRSRYALAITVPMILVVVKYCFHYEDENLYMTMILGALLRTILPLLVNYSIEIDWKDVRSFFW